MRFLLVLKSGTIFAKFRDMSKRFARNFTEQGEHQLA